MESAQPERSLVFSPGPCQGERYVEQSYDSGSCGPCWGTALDILVKRYERCEIAGHARPARPATALPHASPNPKVSASSGHTENVANIGPGAWTGIQGKFTLETEPWPGGAAHTTLQDIAEEASVTRRGIDWRLRDKTAVFNALIESP